jgi:hypothetical protein
MSGPSKESEEIRREKEQNDAGKAKCLIAALHHRIRPDGKTEVVLLPLDLSGDVTDLRRQTEAFVEAVWREVA